MAEGSPLELVCARNTPRQHGGRSWLLRANC